MRAAMPAGLRGSYPCAAKRADAARTCILSLRTFAATPPDIFDADPMPPLTRPSAALGLATLATLAALASPGTARAAEPDCAAPGTPAARLICEHALLAMGNGRIRAQQQRLLQAGAIRQAEIDAFLARRDACTTVACLDTLFSQWNQRAARLRADRRAP